jgi:hypothetical protein
VAVAVGVSVGVGVVGVGVGVGVVGVGVGVVGVSVSCVAVGGSCGVAVGVEPSEAQLVVASSNRVWGSTARLPANPVGRRLRAGCPAFPLHRGRWYRSIYAACTSGGAIQLNDSSRNRVELGRAYIRPPFLGGPATHLSLESIRQSQRDGDIVSGRVAIG